MRVFHELVWDGYVSGSSPVFSKCGLEALLASADQLSIAGYVAGALGTLPTLTVQVEQSFDEMRWLNRNINPEINAVALSTSADTSFSGHDGNPAARPGAALARLRIALGGTNPAAQVRIWATGQDLEGDTTPVTILGAASVLQWCRTDIGVTLNGTTVSTWKDASGAGKDYVQGTGSKQPAFNRTGGPNGTPIMTFDGTDDQLVASGLNLPAPGTTPTYIWVVLKQITWAASQGVLGADAPIDANSYTALNQNPSTPSLRQNNGAAQDNSGLAVGSWGRVELGFSNSTSDFIKCRSTSVTGISAGNNSGQIGRRLGTSSVSGIGFANVAVAEIMYANRIPTAAERAALDAYCTERYGAGLV